MNQPFTAPTAREIRRRHAESLPALPTTRVPGLPSGVDAIFRKLTFKDPALRYDSAAGLLDDLDRLENGETPIAERELRLSRSQ